jgi:hypothetical protein
MMLPASHASHRPFHHLKHQRYQGYIYATAHVHDVDGRVIVRDGRTPVAKDTGFDVAPGDVSDVEVANMHAWGSWRLVFSDGTYAATALRIIENNNNKGRVSVFS